MTVIVEMILWNIYRMWMNKQKCWSKITIQTFLVLVYQVDCTIYSSLASIRFGIYTFLFYGARYCLYWKLLP